MMKPKKAPNWLLAVLFCRCPHCRRGSMFEKSILNLPKVIKVNDSCPVCRQNLVPEPGFYFGAMYISYAFQVGIFISCIFAVNLLAEKPTFLTYAIPILSLGVGLLPIILRLSRALMLYLFSNIKYQKDA